MTETLKPELVQQTGGPPGTMLAVYYIKTVGYFGLASNAGDHSDGPYETKDQARQAAWRLAERVGKGDRLDKYCELGKQAAVALGEGRKDEGKFLAMECVRLQERMREGGA